MEPITVEVTLQRLEGASSSAFIALPADVADRFGRSRPPVRVTLNGHTYDSAVLVYDNAYLIPVNRANCDVADVRVGDRVTVILEPEEQVPSVEPPEDLVRALSDLREQWDKLSHTRRQSLSRWVAEAVQPDIRERRINRTIDELRR